jgi:hypothetical protein
MRLTPEKRLLEAVFRQVIKDYLKLNPDSGLCSAEFYENEGQDFKSAEDFLFNGKPIYYGEWVLPYDEVCLILDINPKNIKKHIFKNQLDF